MTVTPVFRAHHVLFDLNSLIHTAYSTAHTQPKETIQATLALVQAVWGDWAQRNL